MKESVLALLKQNLNEFTSGQVISEKLDVSRTSIWKYINSLRKDGYKIESSSKKGYKLVSSPDILTFEEIKETLTTKYIGKNILHFDSIASTNLKAKELAEKGEAHGSVVISEEQTLGRGRLGRQWLSPKYKGIWFSIILRPKTEPINIPKITQVAAASIVNSLANLNIDAYIKWPNDIIVNHKKVCGILTEMSGELNRVNYVVLGMGVNANLDPSDFNEDISLKATSLKIETGHSIDRKLFISSILNEFEKLYEEFSKYNTVNKSLEICKKQSAVLGKNIKIISGGSISYAKAVDIQKSGELKVEYPDGSTDDLISGEISIRGLNGYI